MRCMTYTQIVLVLLAVFCGTEATSHCSSHGHVLDVTNRLKTLNMTSQSYAADSTCEWLLVGKISLTYSTSQLIVLTCTS